MKDLERDEPVTHGSARRRTKWVATDIQRAIVENLRNRPSATAGEIADATGVSKRHVAKTLARFEEHERLKRHTSAGDFGADIYRLLAGASSGGLADLALEQTANDPLQDSNR